MVDKKLKDKENKQLMWTFVIIAIVFAGFLISYLFVAYYVNTFNFAGVRWEKINQGGITFYHSRFSPSENFVYNAYFRTDPRKNNISINTKLRFYQNVIISLNPNAEECGGANVMGNKMLGEFLTSFGFKVSGAVSDEQKAEELNLSFADCSSSAIGKNVILVQKSEEPSIERDSKEDSCYIINVGDCENVRAVERFIAGVLLQIEQEMD